MNVVVDAYDTSPHGADTNLAHYFSTGIYAHPGSPWQEPGQAFGLGEDSIGFFDSTHPDLSWSEDRLGKNEHTSHHMDLHGPELDLPLSDQSYPASSDTSSPSSTLLYPSAFTPDDDQWHPRSRAASDGHVDLLPPLQLVHPALATPEDRRASLFESRRAINMPYHELSPRATPVTATPENNLTPKSFVVKPYPFVLSHTDMTAYIESPDLPQGQHRLVPLSELTAPYIPDTAVGSLIHSPAVETRTSSLSAISVSSEGVEPARLVSQHAKRPRASYSPSLPSTPSEASVLLHKRARGGRTANQDNGVSETEDAAESEAEGEGEDEDEDEDADADVYLPSRSPSPAFSGSNYSDSSSPHYRYRSRNKRRVKARAAEMMSAADALRFAQSTSGSNSPSPDAFERRPRKNQSIPVPVPVPHLTKKSRGRKVPYVDAQVSRSRSGGVDRCRDDDGDDDDDEGELVKPARGSSSRRGRGGRGGGVGRNGDRTFVCSVDGCGKCFVRGEHLKRHVRSIHTYEKPYPCPYDGCQKSFSRRDNLGQHVRLHYIAA